jgi:nucleoside-diphosphate-sugar epimerase
MQTLVIGGGGPIGQAVVRALIARDDQPLWTSRQAKPPEGAEAGHVLVDRDRPGDIARVVRDRNVETVIDMVAYGDASTRPLLSALQGLLQRYVLVSSCDVYRNYGLLHRLETGDADPSPLDEAAPLRTARFPYRGAVTRAADAPDLWMDDYDKIPIEAAVRAMTCDWTILRLPMVYGPGDRQRRFRWAIAPMVSKMPSFEVPTAWLNWTTTYGYIENVAAAVAHCAADPRAANAVFNVADEHAISHRGWIERLRRATDWTGAAEPTEADTPFSRPISGLDLSVPLNISAQRLFTDLEFVPPVALDTAARLTIADEVARQPGY